jgi:hypothetical protein
MPDLSCQDLKSGETLLSVELFLSVHGHTGEAKFVTLPKEWAE